MPETFSKLFSSITDSTIWAEPSSTRIVWITMLAMADRTGYVGASVPGLANRARVTIEECEAALRSFLSPDPYSRSKDHDGRRIEVVDRGWVLLNYERFRDMRDEDARREYERERKRTQRHNDVRDMSGTIRDNAGQSPNVPACPALSAHTDTDTDTEADNNNIGASRAAKRRRQLPEDFILTQERTAALLSHLPSADPEAVFAHFQDHHRSRGSTMLDWDAAWRTWCRNAKKFSGRNSPNEAHTRSAVERVRAAAAERERAARAVGRDY